MPRLNGPPPSQERRFRRSLWLLTAVALGLRALNVWAIRNVLGEAQILDAAYYHDVALASSRTLPLGQLEGELAFANRGYPTVLQGIYAIHPSPTLVLCFQSLLGAVSVWLIAVTARRLFASRSVGLWSAALFALYAPAIFYDGLLLTPSSSAFLAVALAWSLERCLRLKSVFDAVIAGLAVGAATMLRASQVLYVPIVVAALLRLGGRGKFSEHRLLAFIIAVGGCVVPVVIQQRIASGGWIPVTTNGGMNFWIGNHRGATGTYQDAPFLSERRAGSFQHTMVIERERFLAEARRRSGNAKLSLAGASGFWFHEASREITTQPGAWLGLMGKKALVVLNDYEPRTNASLDLHQELSPVLGYDPVRFGVVLVLGVWGWLHLSKRKHVRARWLLGALTAVPLLTCMLFFVGGEYRHPASVALVMLGGYGIARLVRTSIGGLANWRRASVVLTMAALAILPMKRLGPARDRKTYAEALAMPGADGSLPTLERYARARCLLQRHGDSLEDRIYASEALLLVESNQAIQFRDRDAAIRLIEVAKRLWHEELHPDATIDAVSVARIRGNLVRRVAQLGRQSFIADWAEIDQQLALLGSHEWREADDFLDRGLTKEAAVFLDRAHEMAPNAVQLLAYRRRLAYLRPRAMSGAPQSHSGQSRW